MIELAALKLTNKEMEELLKWSGLFFENGLRLIHLSNFISEKMLDKEIIILFLQQKIREGIEGCEKEVLIHGGSKVISEDSQRLILSMLEMIKLEEGIDEDSEA